MACHCWGYRVGPANPQPLPRARQRSQAGRSAQRLSPHWEGGRDLLTEAGVFCMFKARLVGRTREQGRTERPLWRSKQGSWPPTMTTSKKSLPVKSQGRGNHHHSHSCQPCAKSFTSLLLLVLNNPTGRYFVIPLLQNGSSEPGHELRAYWPPLKVSVNPEVLQKVAQSIFSTWNGVGEARVRQKVRPVPHHRGASKTLDQALV